MNNTHADSALLLTQTLRGPWLAIPANAKAEAAALVLAGDPRAPGKWRLLDGEAAVACGDICGAHLTPLHDFGIAVTLYPHSRVISLTVQRASIARRFGHTAGGRWAWEGKRCDRIKIGRHVWPMVAEAAKASNIALISGGLPQ